MKKILYLFLFACPSLLFGQMFTEEEDSLRVSEHVSVDFDGLAMYASLPHNSGMAFTVSTPFSVEMWVKPLPGGHSNFTSYLVKGSGDTQWYIGVDSAMTSYKPYVRFQLGKTEAAAYFRASCDIDTDEAGSKLWRGFFYHIVGTYSGNNNNSGLKIYINGELATSTNSTAGTPSITGNTDSVYVGRSPSGIFPFGFCLARVYSRALSQGEITLLYNAGKPLQSGPYESVLSLSVLRDWNSVKFKAVDSTDLKNENLFPFNLPKRRYYLSGDRTTVNGFGIWGQPSAFDRPEGYPSPVPGVLFLPATYYDAAENKTYISTMLRGHSWWNRRGQIMILDHDIDEIVQVKNTIPSISLNTHDNHQQHTIIKKGGNLLVGRENGHISPIYVTRSTDGGNTWAELSNFGTDFAYTAFLDLNDTLYAIGRRTISNNYQYNGIVRSTDDGATWSSPYSILTLGDGNWAYPSAAISGDTLAYVIVMDRLESGGWEKLYTYKTTDGENFYNLSGSLVGVRGSNQITRAELTLIDSIADATTYTIGLMDSAVDTAGALNLVYQNREVDTVYYAFWNGSGFTRKALPIPTYYTQSFETGALIYAGGETWDFFRIEARGGFDVVVKYRTTDAFDTIDSGEIVSRTDRNHAYINGTFNKRLGIPITIVGSEIQYDINLSTHLFLYTYTP